MKRLMVVKRLGVSRCHLLRVGHSSYPGNDDLGQAGTALCGVWVGFAHSPDARGLELGDFVRLSSNAELATCPQCRAAKKRNRKKR